MRIVLVDASHTVLHIVSKLLRARGHDVHPVADGAQAFEFLQNHPDCDVLITSVELPSLPGLELCWNTRLLANARRRPFYIIVMSSNDDETKLSEALDSGADEFIRKPPQATALHARLRAAERLLQNENELIRLANIDPLTEILNRRAFFERAGLAVARAEAGESLSAVMVDIDHFKQVNDRHGHDVGDRVIRAVAQEAARIAPDAGRLGGEEFAFLLEGEAAARDGQLAEALRAKCSELRFDGADGPFAISCSLGVAGWTPGTTIDQLLRRADLALYEAKRAGRNRVAHADHSPTDREPSQRSSVVRSPLRTSDDARRSKTRIEA